MYVKNIPYDEDKIINLKTEFKYKINNINKKDFISYDEMSIYLNSVPYKGWSPKEKDCFIKTKNKTIYNKRYSLGMSIDTNSNIDFTIKEKALNGNNFNSFMKKIHKILTCKTSIKSMKYINIDINSVKNMKKIVLSYIEKNEKPLPFIKGIKICNSSMTKE